MLFLGGAGRRTRGLRGGGVCEFFFFSHVERGANEEQCQLVPEKLPLCLGRGKVGEGYLSLDALSVSDL